MNQKSRARDQQQFIELDDREQSELCLLDAESLKALQIAGNQAYAGEYALGTEKIPGVVLDKPVTLQFPGA